MKVPTLVFGGTKDTSTPVAIGRAHVITRALVTAWLDRFVRDEGAAASAFDADAAGQMFPEAELSSAGL